MKLLRYLLLTLLLTGCAHSVLVYAPATLPARVPVQVFPSVWVVGPAERDESYLLDRMASQLAQDERREVRRLEAEQLKAAREAQQVPAVTVVLQLELSLSSGTQDYTDMMPVQYCGMFGCAMQYQTYVNTLIQLTGHATLVVQEGATGRELQRAPFVVSVAGDDEGALQDELWEGMARKLVKAVDLSQTKEPYHLYHSKQPDAAQGVALLERGKWDEGRAALERAAKALGGLDSKAQAQVWYNLGVARMIAPGPRGLDPQSCANARRALDWAQRLLPSPAHTHTIERLTDACKRAVVLGDQRRAQDYNFGIATGG